MAIIKKKNSKYFGRKTIFKDISEKFNTVDWNPLTCNEEGAMSKTLDQTYVDHWVSFF